MIVTLTLNPSVDRTIEVERLGRGEVIRATAARVDPGGKGINVSRALAVHGLKTRAVVVLGGAEGDHLTRLLEQAGVELVPVKIEGSIRSNITVVEPDGTTTKLNEPGASLSDEEVTAVLDTAVAAATDAAWLVVSGSLPPRTSVTVYADLARRLVGTACRVAVDTSGPALAATLSARPALVKPNRQELAECVETSLDTLGDVIDACASLRDRGAGAGDALLAGFLCAGGQGGPALVEAVAWGVAAVRLPGSRMPSPTDVRRDDVRLDDRPRRDLPLLDSA